MKAHQLFAGSPKTYSWKDTELTTSIYKLPVESLASKDSELVGDQQANLVHHGGPYKALYTYALENYKAWETLLPPEAIQPGLFGENIMTEGLEESKVLLGDRFEFGTMTIEASQPRRPCINLNLRLQRTDGVKLFRQSGTYGIYWRIIKDGIVQLGDVLKPILPNPNQPNIRIEEMFPVLYKKTLPLDKLNALLEFPDLDPKLRELTLKAKAKL